MLAHGKVRKRPGGMTNAKLATGEIEVYVDHSEILSEAKPLPFPIEDGHEVSETLRLKYRYLDLRRSSLQHNLMFRHRAAIIMRNYLDKHGFMEIETPILYKSTPEGARDFIVPSRVNAGTFYALPQSPQTLKQLLVVAGYDRYYQASALLSGRGPARRPSARVLADRHRDVVRRQRSSSRSSKA